MSSSDVNCFQSAIRFCERLKRERERERTKMWFMFFDRVMCLSEFVVVYIIIGARLCNRVCFLSTCCSLLEAFVRTHIHWRGSGTAFRIRYSLYVQVQPVRSGVASSVRHTLQGQAQYSRALCTASGAARGQTLSTGSGIT